MDTTRQKRLINVGRYAIGGLAMLFGALTVAGTAWVGGCAAFGGSCDGSREAIWASDDFGGGFLGTAGVLFGWVLASGRWTTLRVAVSVVISVGVGMLLWYQLA